MINNRTVLAFIPARGGSKGIPNKNITPLAGKPLIAYTIEAALQSRYIDGVIVSTDSEEIAAVAREHGADVPFLRPASLASDTAKSIDAVLHCIESLNNIYNIFILLQPTSPLRTAADIDEALDTFLAHGEEGLCSVNLIGDHPILTRTVDEEGYLHPITHAVPSLRGENLQWRFESPEGAEGVSSTIRRQDMPTFYHVNGAIYINRTDEINRNTSFNDNPVAYIMPRERSIDIDEPIDLAIAEAYLKT